MAVILTIIPGRASKKYAIVKDGRMVLELSLEQSDSVCELYVKKSGSADACRVLTGLDESETCKNVVSEVEKYLQTDTSSLTLIAIKIEIPGSVFQKHTVIDDWYVSFLRDKEVVAPFTIPYVVKEIQQWRSSFKNVRLVAVSDSAFHTTIPAVAREFSLPADDALALDVHRFGYHGLSVASAVHRIHALIGSYPAKLVVCTIGTSVSVTAVKNGISVETSMGYAPKSSVPTGSLIGDLDADALLEIMRIKNLKPAEALVYLHTAGGLQGMAGDSDLRRLIDRKANGDQVALHALQAFVYQIKKAIASCVVPLGGLDTIVLTGTAAFRSTELRQLILSDKDYFGLVLDVDKNDIMIGKEGVISAKQSLVKVVVMRADEMCEMARIATQFT
jgi:acetate kinase